MCVKKSVFICLFITLFTSCSLFEIDKSGVVNITHDDFKIVELKGDVLPLDIYDDVFRLKIIDNRAFISNYNGEKCVSVYDIDKCSLIGGIISRGRGAGEMISPPRLDKYNNLLSVYCGTSCKFNVYSFEDLLSFKDSTNINPVNAIVLEKNVLDFVSLNNGKIIALNIDVFDPTRFVVLNSDGKFSETKGGYPHMDNLSIDEKFSCFAFMASMSANKAGTRFVVANKLTDLLEIYDNNGDSISFIKGPDYFDPDITDNSKGEIIDYRFGENSREAYFMPVSTDNGFLVASALGRSRDDSDKNNNIIMSFDWDGKPEVQYVLDNDVILYDVDEENSLLYVLTMIDDQSRLVKYKL